MGGVIIRLLLECIQEFTAYSLQDEEGDGHGGETEGNLSDSWYEDALICERSYEEEECQWHVEEMEYDFLFLPCVCFESHGLGGLGEC